MTVCQNQHNTWLLYDKISTKYLITKIMMEKTYEGLFSQHTAHPCCSSLE